MNYIVEFAPTAAKQLKKLSAIIQHKIVKTIEDLSINPRPVGYKKLAGHDYYRIRVGNYRIIYSINDKIITIFVLKIAHRKDVYR